MVRNTTIVNPHELHRKDYHLTEDIAEDAIRWLREQQAFSPDKPFLMYWAPGASHGPHHIMKEWADKYKGKFDDGWDKYRERAFARQKELGWIPKDAKLTPRPSTLASWDSIPEGEKPFQRRLMEVFAGFTEHADSQRRPCHRRDRKAGEARQHADLLHLGRQWLVGRGPERDDQRTARPERHPVDDPAAHRGAGRSRRPRRPRIARRPTTCTTPAGHGRGARRTSPPN